MAIILIAIFCVSELIADLERQIAIEETNNTQNQQIQAREITLNLDMTTNTSKP